MSSLHIVRVSGLVLALSCLLLPSLAPAQEATEAGSANAASKVPGEVALLQAWLAVRGDNNKHREAYAPYRRAVMGASPPPWVERMERAMSGFAESTAPTIAADLIEELVKAADQRRQLCQPMFVLLPWLLLAARAEPQDLRLQFLLCDAWGGASEVRKAELAQAAAQAVVAGLAAGQGDDGKAKRCVDQLRAFLPECATFKDDEGTAWLAARFGEAVELLQKDEALRPDRLERARIAELEQDYENAMRAGDRDGLEDALSAMGASCPAEPSYQLALAVVVASLPALKKSQAAALVKDGRMALLALPDEAAEGARSKASVRRRLERLGVIAACREVDVDLLAVDQATPDAGDLAYALPALDKLDGKRRGCNSAIDLANGIINKQKRSLEKCDAQIAKLKRDMVTARDKSTFLTAIQTTEKSKDKYRSVIETKQQFITEKQAERDRLDRIEQRMKAFRVQGQG